MNKNKRKERTSTVNRKFLKDLESLSEEFNKAKFMRKLKDDDERSIAKVIRKLDKKFRKLTKKYGNEITSKYGLGSIYKKKQATYFVSASGKRLYGGDGSKKRPYRTVNKALERAKELNLKHLTVSIGSGVYSENLEITRSTSLIGRKHVILKGSIENSNHYLHIKNIHIRDALNRGIRQNGGTLKLEYCSIMRTSKGIAIELSNGTLALLKNFFLNQNQGKALFLTDENTKVEVQYALISQNFVDPEELEQSYTNNSPIGAVEVANGAKLLMEHSLLNDNETRGGVVVRDNGLAHLRFCTISGTNKANVISFQNSTIEIHNFISQKAEGYGLEVDNAYLTASAGLVRENVVGICFRSLPADYNAADCIAGDVLFIDNATRIQGSLPISGPSPPEEPDCPKVSWDAGA